MARYHFTNNSSGNWPHERRYGSDPRVTTRHHDRTGARVHENKPPKYRCPSNASFEAVKHDVEWNTAETGVVPTPNVLFTPFRVHVGQLYLVYFLIPRNLSAWLMVDVRLRNFLRLPMCISCRMELENRRWRINVHV